MAFSAISSSLYGLVSYNWLPIRATLLDWRVSIPIGSTSGRELLLTCGSVLASGCCRHSVVLDCSVFSRVISELPPVFVEFSKVTVLVSRICIV